MQKHVEAPPRLLHTVAEVARMMAVSRQFVYEAIDSGLPVVRLGRVIRIKQSDLDAFLAARREVKDSGQRKRGRA